MKNWVLLGASRGLGLSFLRKAAAEGVRVHCFSRKPAPASDLAQSYAFDFADESQWERLTETIQSLQPEKIFYFAGGGPYGEFQFKNWKDHQWAWRVTFACPAFLLHRFLREPLAVQQFVFIGSSDAESQPDP